MSLAASFCQQVATMSAHKSTQRAVASPDAPQKPLVRKRARSGGVKWVQVSWDEPGRKGKKPPLNGSQQPACSHQEHQILSTAEATAFATQFWDCKEPSKAIKMKFEKFLQALPQAENMFPVTSRGMCAPPLWRGAAMTTTQIRNNE